MRELGKETPEDDSATLTPRQRWAKILASCYVTSGGKTCDEYGTCMVPEDDMCAARAEGEAPLRWRTSS